MTDAAVIALVGMFTTVAGFLFQAWQMERKRKYDKEDAQARAHSIETKLTEHADAVTEKIAINSQKIDRNTEMAGMAYEAANNFNAKLESVVNILDSVDGADALKGLIEKRNGH